MTLSKWSLGALTLSAIIGFIDATYLTVEHYLGLVPPCTLTSGCETVTTSAYSVVLGVPVALLGAIFYLVVLALIVALWDTCQERFLRFLAHVTWLGLAAAIYFTAIQAFVLKAYCQYCLLSALTSTFIFILTQWMWQNVKKIQSISTEDSIH